ncbi:putative cystine transporter YijE [Burkholderiales bacterium]|nr:putative cystine transporter YijE [Burkholderiales bacterium]
MTKAADAGRAVTHSLSHAYLPMAILALIWGCNWPVLKLGVSELPPLTFRSVTLPFAAVGLLAIARASGESIAIPRAWWPRVAALAFFNIAGWNGLVLFGLQQLPAGRSAILAYTMPVWATLVALVVLHEPMNRRKVTGLVLGMVGMALLLGEDFALIRRSPFGAMMILGAAILWSIGTVLLRKWKPPIAQNTLSGWMMLLGWAPLAVAAPFFDDVGLGRFASVSPLAWFAILYNVFLAGMLAHWAWFTLARTLPVAVSGLSSLPVPVVGVFAGMVVLGERPGTAEWLALAFVLASLAAVLWPGQSASKTVPMPSADP